jgi:hypothetical protein
LENETLMIVLDKKDEMISLMQGKDYWAEKVNR